VTDLANQTQTDPLATWLERQPVKRATRRRPPVAAPAGLGFAFYGRVSTKQFQDRKSSHAWQLQSARELIAGHGVITAEFFDTGHSRRRSWTNRPQAATLLAALTNPNRGFDAIVVGEYERAFCGDQLNQLLPLLEQHGVALWLPEAHGPVNPHKPSHQALVMMLGAQSKREVQRSRFRVLAAMRAQAREQGRYLGGRPPYGYRLADAGPHPNTAHAQCGAGGYNAWNPTPPPPTTYGGSSPSASPGKASPVSPERSTRTTSPVRPVPTPTATDTDPAQNGSSKPSPRS
jgi:site-specific DNA recombinase